MKYIMRVVVLFFVFITNAQNITLNDLQIVCNKKSSELVNQYLMNKGWEYYDSEKGDTYKYNTITWAYEKSSYDDKATGWFYLYTYEGEPNKVSYNVFNINSYNKIKKSLSSYGYKLKDDKIENDKIISTYENSKFRIEVTTSKRKDNDIYDRSFTSYSFMLIKKSGIYDPDNGIKTIYWKGTNKIKAIYDLKNGELNGDYKNFYESGNLKMTGAYQNGNRNGAFKFYYDNGNTKEEAHYINDKGNGLFKQYYENGDLEVEYYLKQGKLNGKLTRYENNQKKFTKQFLNDDLEGDYEEYIYNKEGILSVILRGRYIKDKREGKWNYYSLDKDKKETVIISKNYKGDILDGNFQTVRGDSLIFGTYKNDKLNGKYLIYRDYLKMLVGGVIRTDTTNSNLKLETKGQYFNGKENGKWEYFGLNNNLIKTGSFINGDKDGKWRHYYANYVDKLTSKPLKYSGELYLEENYMNDVLHGKSIRYSTIDRIEYDCEDKDEEKCYELKYKKVYVEENYNQGFLEGKYLEKDSTGFVKKTGSFKGGKMNGEWTSRKKIKDYIYVVKGHYSYGYKEGSFTYYFDDDISTKFLEEEYYNNKLDGDSKAFLDGKVNLIKKYSKGSLKKLRYFDNDNLIEEFEVDSNYSLYKKIKKIEYQDNYVISKTYNYYGNNDDFDKDFSDKLFNKSLKKGTTYTDGYYVKKDKMNRKIESGVLKKNIRESKWVFNFYDSNLRKEVEYIEGEIYSEKYYTLNSSEPYSGMFKFMDLENNHIHEIKIKDGLRNGITIIKDNQGNKIKKLKFKEGLLRE
ncbi:toxin-antitoxin system YwqK family antitoxin [Pseudofulvibacter geojedonensis]|uniref:Uncharacterized protein n=1 Tax=Pseudofulvibacter geojedonensis TaxID=1123758 RepID=A0ABW3I3V3_9FLAO